MSASGSGHATCTRGRRVDRQEQVVPAVTGEQAGGRPTLGLWDAVSIIVGIVIGAGIYETAPLIFASVSSPAMALSVWLLGGVLSLVGAACYAELASTYPRSGGDYVYLTRAFGQLIGFLFGWAQLSIVLTGSIGMMAYVFADYAVALGEGQPGSAVVWAATAVIVLTALHIASVSVGSHLQNVLTGAKVLGVSAVILAGVWLAFTRVGSSAVPAAAGAAREGSFGLAMILVLYTFGGWNDAAFVAAEVRDRKRNLPRALLLGTLAVTIIYLLMNAAFLAALGFEGAQRSRAIARDVFAAVAGNWGGAAISILVMVSALGAASALIFTGARVHAALGSDYALLSRLAVWHARFRSPAAALLAQGAVALGLIALVGTGWGRAAIDGVALKLGLSQVAWSGHGGFDTLLSCSAPVFWSFFLLTGLALLRLRRLEPELERPFRVPLYPLTPLVFCATCAYMLYSSIQYAGALTLVGVAPLLIGLPIYFASKRRLALGNSESPLLVSGTK
jgi:basic amino acid/polyamine antiporter, APA family